MSIAGNKKYKLSSSYLEASKQIKLTNINGDTVFKVDSNTNNFISSTLNNEFTNDVKINGALTLGNKISGEINTEYNIIALNMTSQDHKTDDIDIGITGRYWDSATSSYKYCGLYRESELKSWVLFNSLSTNPTQTLDLSGVTLADLNLRTLYCDSISRNNYILSLPNKSGTIALIADLQASAYDQACNTFNSPHFVDVVLG